MDTWLIIVGLVVVGGVLLFAMVTMRTSKLNVDPLQNHLMSLIAGLNENGHTPSNRHRFTTLASGYFDHYGIKREGERQTRLAHALSFVRLSIMPNEYEEMKNFLGTWRTPQLAPQPLSLSPSTMNAATPQSAQASVFISYAREDADSARIIVAQLEGSGFRVWWDDGLQTGGDWASEIKQQLQAAHAVVVLWGPLATVSEWVRKEAAMAVAQGKLVPVILRKCRIPTDFADRHAVDLSEWEGDTGDPGWRRLLSAIERLYGSPSR